MRTNLTIPSQPDSGAVLEENLIGALWHICFVANSFVFPIYAQYDKKYKISRMEFVILYVLSHRDNLMAWEICRMTGLPKNNISRGVNKLEAKKLITRTPDPADARRAVLTITAQGKALFEELAVSYAARAETCLSPLDRKDRKDLERIMTKLARATPSVA